MPTDIEAMRMGEIEYREAVRQDEDALVDLWWEMQSSHHQYEPKWYADKGEQECKATWRQHLAELLADENAVVVVAVALRTPVGMIVDRFGTRPPIYRTVKSVRIDSTVVRPDFRRQGIFRGMLGFLEARAREAGINAVQLNVEKENPARHAYEKTGFTPRMESMLKWL